MKIVLDHSAAKPLYRQLAEHLRGEIESGARAAGARMPAEEELMHQADVSKGTVKAAYTLLRQEGLLRSARGSGTYVRAPAAPGAAEDPAMQIRRFFAEAYRRGEPAAQVYHLFQQQLDQVYTSTPSRCAAMVDCSWELLHSINRQLEGIPGLQVVPYLLGDLVHQHQDIDPRCSLILTTQIHYPAMLRYAGRRGIEIGQLALKEDDRTIAALSKLPPELCACIVYRSQNFLECVLSSMAFLSFHRPLLYAHEDQLDVLEECAAQQMPLILPPDYTEYTGAAALQIIERARKSGCQLIPFRYEVEQGSLLHLQRRLEPARKE